MLLKKNGKRRMSKGNQENIRMLRNLQVLGNTVDGHIKHAEMKEKRMGQEEEKTTQNQTT